MEDRLLCKQEAMGSNPIRSIDDFPIQHRDSTPSCSFMNLMVRTETQSSLNVVDERPIAYSFAMDAYATWT